MRGVLGVLDKRRQSVDGEKIKEALSMMNERGSGEGAGYVAYGIYPEYKDYFALHVFFDNIRENKAALDTLLDKWGTIVHDEQIKTYEQPNIRKVHTPWRYFSRRMRISGEHRSKNSAMNGANSSCQHSGPSCSVHPRSIDCRTCFPRLAESRASEESRLLAV